MQINPVVSTSSIIGNASVAAATGPGSASSLPGDSVLLGTTQQKQATSVDLRTAAGILFSKDKTPERWKHQGDNSYNFPPAVSDDGKTMYVCNNISMTCLSSEGKELWHEYEGTDYQAFCSRDGNHLFMISDDRLRCVPKDITTGRPWSVELKVSTSPAMGPGGDLYAASKDKIFHAFNSGNGEEKWTHTMDAAVEKQPVIGSDGSIYVLDVKGHVHRFDTDGKVLWEKDLPIGKDDPFTVGKDGTLYYINMKTGEDLVALKPDGTEKWRYPTGKLQETGPAEGPDGALYLTCLADHSVHAISSNGKQKWTFPLSDMKNTGLKHPAPVVGPDGNVYAGDIKDKLYVLNSADGSILRKEDLNYPADVTPAITRNGDIVIASCTGEVEFFRGTLGLINEQQAQSELPPQPEVLQEQDSVNIDGAVLKKRKPKFHSSSA